ncbi:MAG: polysaccharide deacetylase family protein [Fimbriimonadaceae bacterium]|nr:polysaccharide deacetylase family protein [Fimbriimonadaceae bacterium]
MSGRFHFRPLVLAVLSILAMLGVAGCLPNPFKQGGSEAEAKAPPEDPWALKEYSLLAPGMDAFVLMYHDVLPERDQNSLWWDVTTQELYAQIEKLEAWGATFVSIEEIYRAMVDNKPLPPRAVALTFDDSYQGFYDNAWPLLRDKKIPSAVFVHTAFVGSQSGRPKMNWDRLKELSESGLVTIGSHTVNHPAELGKLTEAEQIKELTESKKRLEDRLGIEIRSISWPNGEYSRRTIELAREAGYRFAFAMDSGPAWKSESVMEVLRYNPVKLDEAMAAAESQEDRPLGGVFVEWSDAPIRKEIQRINRVPLSMVIGGRPSTVIVAGREAVSDVVENFDAQAGINGGFFQMAAIASNDNRMIGPSKTSNVGMWFADQDLDRVDKLVGRPMVAFTKSGLLLTPFRAAYNQEDVIRKQLPDVTDVFVAGAWLVHQGQARSREQIMSAATSDAMDFRRRAVFGITEEGIPVLVACTASYDSARLAAALQIAGLREAVLLDSGFSTSLVHDGEILASGHATPEKPSRPVPHAIILKGTYANASELETGMGGSSGQAEGRAGDAARRSSDR